MEPNETEFLGENELISIIPTFNSGVIHLISGDIGPFRASLPIRVPLWLALYLKHQQKCKFQLPDWMDSEMLDTIRENEKSSRTFTKLPSDHYMIEAKSILGNGSEDISNIDDIRTTIKDIWDLRLSKLRSSVDVLVKNTGSYAAVDFLTLMEINSIRPILPQALEHTYRLKKRPNYSQNYSVSSSDMNKSSRTDMHSNLDRTM